MKALGSVAVTTTTGLTVHLTTTGRTAARRVLAVKDEVMRARVVSELGEQRCRALVSELDALTDAARHH